MNAVQSSNTFEILSAEGHIVVKLNGRLEADSAKRFLEQTPELLVNPPMDIIFNLEHTSDLSPPWIRCLTQLSQKLKAVNKQLRLILVSPPLSKQLRQEGVDIVLKSCPSLRDALIELGLVRAKMIDVNFVNPFLNSTIQVLKIQAGTVARAGKIYKKNAGEKFQGDISGVIGLVSDAFAGSVVISFPEVTFLKILSRMLGEDQKAMSKEVENGAGELTNIIFGQAKVELNEKGYGLKTALPSVISGSEHSIQQLSTGPRVVIPFETDVGAFFVEICLSA